MRNHGKTLKLRETPKTYGYEGSTVMCCWLRVMPERYRDNAIRFEPQGKEWIILTQAICESSGRSNDLTGVGLKRLKVKSSPYRKDGYQRSMAMR